MFGAHYRGFAWKEIAKALHMTRAAARATFWREIKRSRSKSVEAEPSAIVIQDGSDSDAPKLRKPRPSR
jgi:regulator of protease activity HflC (stomatin/prohibitin superfamily)